MEFQWLELFLLGLLASVKFLFAPAALFAAGYGLTEAVVVSALGGFAGVLVFFKSGKAIFGWWQQRFGRNSRRKKFTRINRTIIKLRGGYGLVGLAFVTPCIISIPVGCAVAAKYYATDRRTLPWLFAAVVFWSLVLNLLTFFIGPLFD